MAGYPCCCNPVLGGTWDLYNLFASPYILDMLSHTDQLYIREGIDGNSGRSFYRSTLGFPDDIIYNNIDSWFINQLSPLSDLSLSRNLFNTYNIPFFPNSYDISSINHNEIPSVGTDGFGHNGIVNLHTSDERILQFNTHTDTGNLLTESQTISSTGFNVYKKEFSNLQIKSTKYKSENVERLEKYQESSKGYLDLEVEGYTVYSDNGLRSHNLADMVITGIYSDLKNPIYTRSHINYEVVGNPVVEEKFYDLYGVGDEYPGSSATYDTGTYRYEAEQPFYTGVSPYIQHSIDLPTGLFDVSTLGYSTGFDLPTTGTYVALYGYYEAGNFGTFLTGIQSTGTLDYYADNVKNLMPNISKISSPLVSEFTLLDENEMDEYRLKRNSSNGLQQHEKMLIKVDLCIKPDEMRTFVITLNEHDTINNDLKYLSFADPSHLLNDNAFIHIDLEGKVYQGMGEGATLTPEPFTNYTIDQSGFYNISVYIEETNETFVDMTGQPTIIPPIVYSPGTDQDYINQYISEYNDSYSKFNSASGYLPYDSLNERSLYIYPRNGQYLNDNDSNAYSANAYIGSSGDGFYLKSAAVSIYDRKFSTSVINTNVKDKTWVTDSEESMMDQSKIDSEFLISENYSEFSDFDYYPLNIFSYNKDQVDLFNFNLRLVTDGNVNYKQVAQDPRLLGFTHVKNRINFGTDLNTYFLSIPDNINNSFIIQPKYLKYDVGGNSFATGENVEDIVDINTDSFRYHDILCMLERDTLDNESEDVEKIIRPSVIDTSEEKALMLTPDANCFPGLMFFNNNFQDLKVDSISYNYHLNSGYQIESVEKFNRSGENISPFVTGVRHEDIEMDHIDSYKLLDYAVPVSGQFLGTTTILRPTGGPESNTGLEELTHEGYFGNEYHDFDFYNTPFDPENTTYPDYSEIESYQYREGSSGWLYPIFSKHNGNYSFIEVTSGTFDPTDVFPWELKIQPDFIDPFVANNSPFIMASGYKDLSDPIVNLFPMYVLDPTGINLITNGNDESYVDYCFSKDVDDVNFSTGNWTALSQSPTPINDYQYKVYGDNYAFHWPETINEDGISLYSFSVNGNYIFQNVSGLGVSELNFKVGPNNLGYVIKGEVISNEYVPYLTDISGENFKAWRPFERNQHGWSDPPTTEFNNPTFDIKCLSLNGSETWSKTLSSQTNPYIIGITDNHFYVEGLQLNVLPSYSTLISEYAITQPIASFPPSFYDISGSSQSYDLLFSNGTMQSSVSSWMINISDGYAFSKDNFNGQIEDIDEEMIVSDYYGAVSGPLYEEYGVDRMMYDKILITNNSQITKTPAQDTSVVNFKVLDYAKNTHVWNSGFEFYEADYDYLEPTGWLSGDDCFISGNILKLNTPEIPFTGDGVSLYKHTPVEVGKTYALKMSLLRHAELVHNEYEIYFSHSGVHAEGSLVGTQEVGGTFSASGMKTEFGLNLDFAPSTTSTSQTWVYTVTDVDNPLDSPLLFKFRSKDKEEFEWDTSLTTEDPDVLTVRGLVFCEVITTGIFPEIEMNTGYPRIIDYQPI